jgi:hypothetical protein
MKNVLILFLAGLLLFSCNNYSVNLAIDNPTDDYVILQIDELTVEIPPREVVWVEMGPGERKFVLENDSIIPFNFKKGVYMINPTFSQYLLAEEIYGYGQPSMPSREINFYGLEFEGPYEVIKDFVEPIRWEYGPREVLPEMMEIDGSYALVKKLMDFQELLGDILNDTGSYEDDAIYEDDQYTDDLFIE